MCPGRERSTAVYLMTSLFRAVLQNDYRARLSSSVSSRNRLPQTSSCGIQRESFLKPCRAHTAVSFVGISNQTSHEVGRAFIVAQDDIIATSPSPFLVNRNSYVEKIMRVHALCITASCAIPSLACNLQRPKVSSCGRTSCPRVILGAAAASNRGQYY